MKLNSVQQNWHGFTLVEILVAISLMAIIGTLLVTIFANTLRGSNKARILANIKHNGQNVLENMTQTTRNADRQICDAGLRISTIVFMQKDIYTRYRIVPVGHISSGTVPAACVSNPPADQSNGCIIWDHPAKQTIGSTLETEDDFKRRVCGTTDLMSAALLLTDPNPETGVKIFNGFFRIDKPAGGKSLVTIDFKLSPGVKAPNIISNQIDPVEFQTTVQIRNDVK